MSDVEPPAGEDTGSPGSVALAVWWSGRWHSGHENR